MGLLKFIGSLFGFKSEEDRKTKLLESVKKTQREFKDTSVKSSRPVYSFEKGPIEDIAVSARLQYEIYRNDPSKSVELKYIEDNYLQPPIRTISNDLSLYVGYHYRDLPLETRSMIYEGLNKKREKWAELRKPIDDLVDRMPDVLIVDSAYFKRFNPEPPERTSPYEKPSESSYSPESSEPSYNQSRNKMNLASLEDVLTINKRIEELKSNIKAIVKMEKGRIPKKGTDNYNKWKKNYDEIRTLDDKLKEIRKTQSKNEDLLDELFPEAV